MTSRRRGLAPLELVFSLPVLLLVMALMINFGTVACWKVRALGVARNSLWGNRLLRSTANSPRPSYWPPTAGTGAIAQSQAQAPDGPRITLLGPPGLVDPNSAVMDPTLGLVKGSSQLARQFPLLRKLGQYELKAQTELLDDKWEFQGMQLPVNWACRIPLIYRLATNSGQELWAQAYSQARREILNMLFRGKALWPLDRDEEFIYYGAFGVGPGRQDFHPPRFIPGFPPGAVGAAPCTVDKQVMAEWVYGTDQPMMKSGLIDQIEGNPGRNVDSVAKHMARRFIELYQTVIVSGRAPPGLQQKIDILIQFLQTL